MVINRDFSRRCSNNNILTVRDIKESGKKKTVNWKLIMNIINNDFPRWIEISKRITRILHEVGYWATFIFRLAQSHECQDAPVRWLICRLKSFVTYTWAIVRKWIVIYLRRYTVLMRPGESEAEDQIQTNREATRAPFSDAILSCN